jgi:hypothetical protein
MPPSKLFPYPAWALEWAQALQDKLEAETAATSENKSARDRLARITAKKAILLMDHEEMRSVCEEQMEASHSSNMRVTLWEMQCHAMN